MEKSLSITASGRVQGVGFRYYTQKVAMTRGLKGFVKNLSNGDVYIEAQGPEEQLTAFLTDVKKGPFLARVDNMIVNEMVLKEFSEFSIR